MKMITSLLQLTYNRLVKCPVLYVVIFRVFNLLPYPIKKRIKKTLYFSARGQEGIIVEKTKSTIFLYTELKKKNAHRY